MRRTIALITILLGAALTLIGVAPANADGEPGEKICVNTPSPLSGSVCTPGDGICIPRVGCVDEP